MIEFAANTLKRVAFATLAVLAVADLYYRARGMLYMPDEIYNLDPILTFFRTGDYTSASQGGHPFDPVLSAGIAATWLNGVVFAGGAGLLNMRIFTGLVHMTAVVALGTVLIRKAGLKTDSAALLAMASWTAMIPVGSHDLRIINGGEMWGAIYLAAGVALLPGRPRLAIFVWGCATWLIKIIYLPFAGVLAAAAVAIQSSGSPYVRGTAANVRGARQLVRNGAAAGAIFAAPLIAWMALIWIRYDASTLAGWIGSYTTFVAKHAAAVSIDGLPVHSGWSFNPQWNDAPLLQWGWQNSARYLVPLIAAAAVIAAHTLARVARSVRPTLAANCVFAALCIGLAVELIWFFFFDPTQWGRHLMPAIYVAGSLALYCAVDLYRSTANSGAAVAMWAGAAVAVIVATSGHALQTTRDYASIHRWKASYAATCKGPHVLAPPCGNNDTLLMVSVWAKEICGPATQPFHPMDQCMTDNRSHFLARAAAILDDPERTEREVEAAAYMTILVQNYNYPFEDMWRDDFAELVCTQRSPLLHRRLRETGFDVDAALARCAQVQRL